MREVPTVPDMTIIDVLPGAPSWALADLCAVHAGTFGVDYAARYGHDYLRETAHLARIWRTGGNDPLILEHQWLVRLGERPCGQFVSRVNLRRRVVCITFVGAIREFRRLLPADWLVRLFADLRTRAQDEAAARHVTLLGAVMEVEPTNSWARRHDIGAVGVDIGYTEPIGDTAVHVPMHLYYIDFRRDTSPADPELLAEGVRAFWIDTYGVSAGDPRLAALLQGCDDVPLPIDHQEPIHT